MNSVVLSRLPLTVLLYHPLSVFCSYFFSVQVVVELYVPHHNPPPPAYLCNGGQ